MTSLINELIMWGKDLKVLYVEDDPALREELNLLLSDIFELVTLAQNGQDGLQKLQENEYDLVITDIRMPVMDGIEMIENIKKSHKNLPIIVVSAHNEVEYLLKLINLNIENFVTKPIRSEQVFTVLYRVIANINRDKELRRYKQELEVANQKLKKLVDVQARSIDFKTSVLNSYRNALYEVALVSVTDKEGVIKDANENFLKELGYTKEEIVGKKHNLFKHPETDSATYKEIWETINNKKVWHGMLVNQTKTFKPVYHYTTIIPILDDKDEIFEFLAVKQDLTRIQEQNQEKLTKSIEISKELKYEEILKAIPMASFTIDTKAIVKHYNRLFEEYISELDEVEHYSSLVSNTLKIYEFLEFDSNVTFDSLEFIDALCDINNMATLKAQTKTIYGDKELYLRLKKMDSKTYIGCLLCKEELETCFLATES